MKVIGRSGGFAVDFMAEGKGASVAGGDGDLDAPEQFDRTHHSAVTLEKTALARLLRDELKMQWNAIAKRIGVAPTTAIYLYGCHPDADEPTYGVRRARSRSPAVSRPTRRPRRKGKPPARSEHPRS